MSDPYGPAPYGGQPGLPTGLGQGQLRPDEEKTWALLAHLSGLLAAWLALGVLGPLVVLLVQGNRSPFVRRHALESLNFQITLLALCVLGVLVTVLTAGLGFLLVVPAGLVVGIWALVGCIRAALAGYAGEEFRYSPIWRPLS